MKWILIVFLATDLGMCQTTPKKHHHTVPKHHAGKTVVIQKRDPEIDAIIKTLRDRPDYDE